MYELLEKINVPADLRKLSVKELKQLCGEIRQYMVECCAKNPGHLGSSLGAVELIVALHSVFDTPKDHLVFDVGHQAYAHKILTGRREAFRRNRMADGISGFPRRKRVRRFRRGTCFDIHLGGPGLCRGGAPQGERRAFRRDHR